MTIHLTADLHLGHANICEYCNRPFISADEMDAALIDNWNKHVAPDDTVYLLGDLTLQNREAAWRYLNQLQGHIKIIPGNHDMAGWLKGQWKDVKYIWRRGDVLVEPAGWQGRAQILPPIYLLRHEGNRAVLSHYALRTWYHRDSGVAHFYGHSHGTLPPVACSLDVGVDSAFKRTGTYRPFRLSEAWGASKA